MSAKDIRAGRAFVEVTIRDRLQQGIRRAMTRLRTFAAGVKVIGSAIAGVGAAFAGIGAAVGIPLAMAAKSFADAGSKLHDLAAQTGLSVEQLSELKFAAEQSGSSLNDVAVAIKNMQRQGIAAGRLDEIAASIAAIEDPTQRAQAALKIFGKSGVKLLPMLMELGKLREQARSSGLIISTEDAARADALGDALDRLRAVFKALQVRIGAEFAGAFTEAADIITGALIGVAKLAQHLSSVIAVVGASFMAVSSTATTAFGGIVDALRGSDLLLAWNIIATTMQVVWNKVVGSIQQTMFNVLESIVGAFQKAANTIGATILAMEVGLAKLAGKQIGLGSKEAFGAGRSLGVVKGALGAAGDITEAQTADAIADAMNELGRLRQEAARIADESKISRQQQVASSIDLTQPRKGVEAVGTFNAAAAGLLGRSGTPQLAEAKKTNNLLQQQNGKLDDIRNAIEDGDGGLAFS